MAARTRCRRLMLLPALALVGSVAVGVSGDGPAGATVPGLLGRIAFSSDSGGVAEIWVRDFGSGTPTRLSNFPGSTHHPAWSPDGNQLAMAVSEPSGFGTIYLIDDDGLNSRSLTTSTAHDAGPDWSRDGKHIAYSSTEAGPDEDIWVVDVDTGVRANLTPGSNAMDYQPKWSPDGSQIAFVSERSGNADIWIMDADGGNPMNLTAHPGVDVGPSWAPDGAQLSFISTRDNIYGDVYRVWTDVPEPVRMTNNARALLSTAWSPDGTLIAYSSIKDGDWDIWMIAADGTGNPGHLTDNPANEYEVAWESVNRPPVVVDDQITLGIFDPVSGNVLDNDSDADGDTLRLVDVSFGGAYGSITYDEDGSFTYEPPALFELCDLSENAGYRVEDGRGGSVLGHMQFTLVPPPDPPPAPAGPELGNDFRISMTGPDGHTGYGADAPDLVYDAGEYVIVWSADHDVGTVEDEFEIWGQRLHSGTGSPVGAPVRISTFGPSGDSDYDAVSPALAHNTMRDEYLVAWNGHAPVAGMGSPEGEIYVQRLQPDVGISDPIRVSFTGLDGDGRSAWSPAVAYNSNEDEYLVVWRGSPPSLPGSHYEIFAQRLTGDGQLLGSLLQVSVTDQGGTYAVSQPDVVYNPVDNEYLVVWPGAPATGSLTKGEFEIFGQRIDANGAKVGAGAFRISDMGSDGQAQPAALEPSVAYSSVTNEYLAVWRGVDAPEPWNVSREEIYGQRVSAGGSEVGPNDFPISDMNNWGWAYRDAETPAVVYDSQANEYLVTWSGTDPPLACSAAEIYGQRLSADGAELGTNDFRVSDMGPDGAANYEALAPAVAFNPDRGEYLVVWYGSDDQGGLVQFEEEIFGQRLAAPGAATGTVTGVVRLDGQPLEGVTVWLGEDVGGDQVDRHTCTDASGAFTFSNIPTGIPLLTATGPSTAGGCPNSSFVDALGAALTPQFWYHRATLAEADEFTLTAGTVAALDFDVVQLGPDHTTGLVDPAKGEWHLRSVNGVWTSFYYGVPGDYPIMGDWDCDGVETPGLYRQSDGYAYLRNSNTTGVADLRFYFGIPGDIPLAGDFDGDGCDTVSIYRPSEGRVFISNQLGENEGAFVADFDYYFGNPGDKPFCGDFNGNGVETIGLHRESSGLVYFRQTHTQGFADDQFYYGVPGDRLVSGDWGIVDGVFTMGIYRPSTQTTYLRYFNSLGIADLEYYHGEPDWFPIAGCTSDSCWLVQ